MRKEIITWIFDNQAKAIIILFSTMFLIAFFIPEGGGNGGGSSAGTESVSGISDGGSDVKNTESDSLKMDNSSNYRSL